MNTGSNFSINCIAHRLNQLYIPDDDDDDDDDMIDWLSSIVEKADFDVVFRL